jgi:citrate lyase subunit beta/citryl-CoA lyase
MDNPMRTLLSVPDHVPAKISETLECRADCVVLDLEDTVPIAKKSEAGEIVVRTISILDQKGKIGVRVNSSQPHLEKTICVPWSKPPGPYPSF